MKTVWNGHPCSRGGRGHASTDRPGSQPEGPPGAGQARGLRSHNQLCWCTCCGPLHFPRWKSRAVLDLQPNSPHPRPGSEHRGPLVSALGQKHRRWSSKIFKQRSFQKEILQILNFLLWGKSMIQTRGTHVLVPLPESRRAAPSAHPFRRPGEGGDVIADCWGLNCAPERCCGPAPSTCERDVFGNRVLANDAVKVRSCGWALIQQDLSNRSHLDTQTDRHKGQCIKAHRECHLQPRNG